MAQKQDESENLRASHGSAALIPCPWCKSSPELVGVGEPGQDGEPTVWRVECDCLWEQYENPKDAISAWNSQQDYHDAKRLNEVMQLFARPYK